MLHMPQPLVDFLGRQPPFPLPPPEEIADKGAGILIKKQNTLGDIGKHLVFFGGASRYRLYPLVHDDLLAEPETRFFEMGQQEGEDAEITEQVKAATQPQNPCGLLKPGDRPLDIILLRPPLIIPFLPYNLKIRRIGHDQIHRFSG